MNTYSMRKSAAMVLALSLLHVSSVLAQDDNTNSKEEGNRNVMLKTIHLQA